MHVYHYHRKSSKATSADQPTFHTRLLHPPTSLPPSTSSKTPILEPIHENISSSSPHPLPSIYSHPNPTQPKPLNEIYLSPLPIPPPALEKATQSLTQLPLSHPTSSSIRPPNSIPTQLQEASQRNASPNLNTTTPPTSPHLSTQLSPFSHLPSFPPSFPPQSEPSEPLGRKEENATHLYPKAITDHLLDSKDRQEQDKQGKKKRKKEKRKEEAHHHHKPHFENPFISKSKQTKNNQINKSRRKPRQSSNLPSSLDFPIQSSTSIHRSSITISRYNQSDLLHTPTIPSISNFLLIL